MLVNPNRLYAAPEERSHPGFFKSLENSMRLKISKLTPTVIVRRRKPFLTFTMLISLDRDRLLIPSNKR